MNDKYIAKAQRLTNEFEAMRLMPEHLFDMVRWLGPDFRAIVNGLNGTTVDGTPFQMAVTEDMDVTAMDESGQNLILIVQQPGNSQQLGVVAGDWLVRDPLTPAGYLVMDNTRFYKTHTYTPYENYDAWKAELTKT